MALETTFVPIELEGILPLSAEKKAQGWRFVQIMAVNTEAGIDLIYSFMKDGLLENYEVKGLQRDAVVPSITGDFLEAFVFENETHDLFGVTIEGIAIDFGGSFYALAQKEPMTVISPAQKAARDKAKKVAAAKAAKEAGTGGEAAGEKAELDAKLADMDPEKAAKVRAALEAKMKKEAAAKQAATDEKIANLDPEKAAKVKAAMEAKAAREKAKAAEAAAQKEGE
ncbi:MULTISPECIES: NADH-quinone oxidoreductase subunit C [Gordonibacter]|uniref:NADH-quinone oxidoreductase subunit C n=1 Tax=Gordonibacter faecis TaxID=3047475 RepID=A0ABT7DIK8_9ACTN|nr:MULTISPECIES: NADH-quinone oxidoreductase subunit C [unclassified Gordonibacter]MDJ1649363.1 NADH-quinone oxidoreductase subunit C [Gordonibacter sp. KGMB12511]HIW75170.1 NADH-quinone oxidoreductase subunit C [Candidatus Gordonibacter avicola]